MSYTIVALVLLGLATPAFDSDGYYCVGPDYIAYQFSFSDEVPGHHLFIVRLGAEQDMTPEKVELPQFQVHGLMCGSSEIEVLGWSSHYRFVLQDTGPALRAESELVEPGADPPGFVHHENNLGFLQPIEIERYPLLEIDGGFRYELRFERTDMPDRYELMGTTTLVELDRTGAVRRTLGLYRGEVRWQ